MMKKIALLLCFALLTTVTLSAAEPKKSSAQLKKEYDALYEKSLSDRVKRIKATPELAKLHAEIVAKQQILADKLAEDDEIAAQTAKLAKLEDLIAEAEAAEKKAAQKKAETKK